MDPRGLLSSSSPAHPALAYSSTSSGAEPSQIEGSIPPQLQQTSEEEEEEEDAEHATDEAFLLTDAEAARIREEDEARIIKAINLSVKSAGHLTNLLPTGTLLFFQFLLPILSNGGDCAGSPIYAAVTLVLLITCGAWCFFLSFTDTIKAPNGKLYHGVATPRGLWLPARARSAQVIAASSLSQFRLCALDFLHAMLSLSVFAAVALFTPDVATCLLPNSGSLIPGQLQNTLPLVVGFVASFLCILFPSSRRSFDQPLLERLVDESE